MFKFQSNTFFKPCFHNEKTFHFFTNNGPANRPFVVPTVCQSREQKCFILCTIPENEGKRRARERTDETEQSKDLLLDPGLVSTKTKEHMDPQDMAD